MKLPIERAWDVLKSIDAGRTRLVPTNGLPTEVFAGDVHYDCLDEFEGWRVVVFNDCHSFDYIDSIEGPEGAFDFADGAEAEDDNQENPIYWEPSKEKMLSDWLWEMGTEGKGKPERHWACLNQYPHPQTSAMFIASGACFQERGHAGPCMSVVGHRAAVWRTA